jgi:PAS domain S-box-containing protein
VARDLTETRRTERALEESEARMRMVLEHSSNVFYSHTPEGELTYVSPQTRDFFDCEPEKVHTYWWEFVTDHPGNQVAVERTRRAIETAERQPVYELELETVSGRRLWVEVNEAPVVQDGEVIAIVGALTDITERKQAEEARGRLEAQLRNSQRLEAVGRLAGGVAHDFNNLLTAIQGYAELLQERWVGDSQSLDELAEIRRAAGRAASLTNQLLAFSRRQVLEPKVLDLNVVVTDLQNMLQRLIGEDVDLVIRRHPGIGRVLADPGQLEQVLLNLVVNARDAMPRGGRLLIETVDVEVDEADQARRRIVGPGRYAMLAVSDTGHGIPPEIREHLFEPFFTTKEQGKGTGLGLATVYGIVKQSGGYVFVYSEPGEGTTFKIYLPLTDRPYVPGGEARDPEGETVGTERILVCEDDGAVRRLTVDCLVRRGYDVQEAASGEEALQVVAADPRPFDLVVSDVVLPDQRGPELYGRLRLASPGLKVLFISGYTEGALSLQSGWNGDAAFLAKPFTPRSLAAKVREVLE